MTSQTVAMTHGDLFGAFVAVDCFKKEKPLIRVSDTPANSDGGN
jgi:hypothetical protein